MNDIDDVKARLLAALRQNQANSLAAANLQPDDLAPRRERLTGRLTCSTGKACFSTEGAARRRLQEILDSAVGVSLYVPTKVRGPCPKCGCFHLTSKAGKQWKRGKNRRNDVR